MTIADVECISLDIGGCDKDTAAVGSNPMMTASSTRLSDGYPPDSIWKGVPSPYLSVVGHHLSGMH